jgi:hypothetical protein
MITHVLKEEVIGPTMEEVGIQYLSQKLTSFVNVVLGTQFIIGNLIKYYAFSNLLFLPNTLTDTNSSSSFSYHSFAITRT